jgi:hypothetical protein
MSKYQFQSAFFLIRFRVDLRHAYLMVISPIWNVDCSMHGGGRSNCRMSIIDPQPDRQIEPGVHCSICRALRAAFVEAVREVVALNELHVKAVLEDEADPHRFELLIHAANERKQNAKYAFVHHCETHSGSCE